MIIKAETSLSQADYDALSDPAIQKDLRVEAYPWQPDWAAPTWQDPLADAPSQPSRHIVYDGKLYRTLHGHLIYWNGAVWATEMLNFEHVNRVYSTLHATYTGHATFATDGTALHAVCCVEDTVTPANSGIYSRYKATPVSAWTAWTKVTVSGVADTTARILWQSVALSSFGTDGTPDASFPVANLFDGNPATFYRNNTGPSGVSFNVPGAVNICRLDIRARQFTEKKFAKRLPSKFTIQAPNGVDIHTVTGQTGWKAGELRSFYFGKSQAVTTNWALRFKATNGPAILEIADIAVWHKGSETKGTFRAVAMSPDNPGTVFAVMYNGPKDAWEICRIERSGTNYATWGAPAADKIYWQYEPKDISAAKISVASGNNLVPSGDDLLPVYGLLLSAPVPGERIETYADDTLSTVNEKADGMTFFYTGRDYYWFSDGQYIDKGSGRLSAINGRWTITAVDQTIAKALPKPVVGTTPPSLLICKIYQSVNGEDWSLPKWQACPDNTAGVGSPAFVDAVLYNSELHLMWQRGHTKSYNPPEFGASPTMVDITTSLEEINFSQAEMLSGSMRLDNRTGTFDAHATLDGDKPWLLHIYAGLIGGAEQKVATCLTDNINFDNMTTDRSVSISFRDMMGLLIDGVRAEEAYITEPVYFGATRSRDSNIQILQGSASITDQTGGLQLEVSSIVFRADSAEMRNGKWVVSQPSVDTYFIVRGADAKNFIRFGWGTTNGFRITHFVNGLVWEDTIHAGGTSFPAGIAVDVRYGAIEFKTTGLTVTHVINNAMRLTTGAFFGGTNNDSLYRGAFGYWTYTAGAVTYGLDYFVTEAPLLSVEKTIRQLAARAGVFDVKSVSILPTTDAEYTATGHYGGSTAYAGVNGTTASQFAQVQSLELRSASFMTPIAQLVFYPATVDRVFKWQWRDQNDGRSTKMWPVLSHAEMGERSAFYSTDAYVNVTDGVNTYIGSATRSFGALNFANLANIRLIFEAGYTAREHPVCVTNNINGEPSYSWWCGAVVYIMGRQFAGVGISPTKNVSGVVSPLLAPEPNLKAGIRSTNESKTTNFWHPFMSSLQMWSDPITIDPGETPMSSLQRTIEGLNLRMQTRFDGSIAAYSYEDTKKRGIMAVIERTDQSDVISSAVARDGLTNHVRMVGAYVEGEYADADSIRRHGHRFQVIHNPYLYTETECRIEAQRTVERSISDSEPMSVQVHYLPLLEPEDHITVQDDAGNPKNIVVVQQQIGGNFVGPNHQIAGRKSTL